MNSKTLLPIHPPAILALANGSCFSGISIGAEGLQTGEVVFNTSMTGYQEILSDPSYCEQLVTLTYPQIGNVGVNPHDEESDRVWANGLIIREMSPTVSNWRSQETLSNYLKKHQVIAIAGIDTRRLTRILREEGAQNGCLVTGTFDLELALQEARNYKGLSNRDLTEIVSTCKPREWKDPAYSTDSSVYHVVVYDFGVKKNILRGLYLRNCRITLVPPKTTTEDVLRLSPDGIVLSNGPGDPAACLAVIANLKELLKHEIPIFGICLGFQLLALAFGANTFKMKFGHHGANHPVQELSTGRIYITSQNHGFAVDENSLQHLPLTITHRSLFDNTIQGFTHQSKPVYGFQGHPEAGPGPQDIDCLFDHLLELMSFART